MITNHQTPLLVASNIILIILLLLLAWPSLSRNDMPPSFKNAIRFLILLFCLYSFWGADWFHYQYLFGLLKNNPIRSSHLEPFYIWLIKNITPNYFIFRLVIWGGALAFLYWTIRVLDLDTGATQFFFVAGFLIWFSYSRATLAMSIMFFSAVIISQESCKYRFSHLLLGSIGLLISIFLHKSAVLGVAIIAMALLLTVVKTKTYRVVILLMPIIILGLRYVFVNITDFVSYDDYVGFVASYAKTNLTLKTSEMGIGSLVQNILEKLPYFMTAICGILLQRQRYELPRPISCIVNILILLVIISTVLLFVDLFNTKLLSIRLFRFCIIPSTILLSYCWECGLNIYLVKTTLWLCIISTTYQLMYAFYVIL